MKQYQAQRKQLERRKKEEGARCPADIGSARTGTEWSNDTEKIPLIDCGENDFIVYHFVDKIWSKFNIIDETVFKKNSLKELLK